MDVLAQRLQIVASENNSRIGIKACPLMKKIVCPFFADGSLLIF